jgi:hypothetical protein
MPLEPTWIATRVEEARQQCSPVTAAASRVESLLMTVLTERQCPHTELTTIAQSLLEDLGLPKRLEDSQD